MQGQCLLRFQVPPSPETSLGGWERRAGAAKPARMCHCWARHAPLPAPGRSDGSAVPGPRSHPSDRAPGREGARTPLTMLAGGGAAQVSWLSSFGHVPLAQFRSWSRQAREVPRPCKDNRCPTRAPRGPSKKSAAPRPASSGTPGTIHLDPPAPPQGN